MHHAVALVTSPSSGMAGDRATGCLAAGCPCWWEWLILFLGLCSQQAEREDFTPCLCLSGSKHSLMVRKEAIIPSMKGETEAQGVEEEKDLPRVQEGTSGMERNASDDLS